MNLTKPSGSAAASADGYKYYLIFFAAGMPALIYQVAWQRVLALYFGVDLYSTTVTVASFMMGLGFGSLAGGQIADRAKRPALLYALIELLIGLFGIASITLFSVVGEAFAGSPLQIIIPVNFLLLLVPAILMGMTLPLMCRIVDLQSAAIGRHLSWLYGVNTLGAAVGAFLTAYLLLGIFGIDGASYLAATMNFLLAGATVLLFRWTSRSNRNLRNVHAAKTGTAEIAANVLLRRNDFYVLAFLSGLVGLGYEIAWYRLLGCLLHGTVYVFGTILTIYLLGIALGALASRRRVDQPGAAQRFALSQVGIALYTVGLFVLLGHFSWLPGLRHVIAASTYMTFHPAPELMSGEVNMFTLYSLLDIPFWAIALLGIPTFLLGYGFPNLMRAASQSVGNLGRSVGAVYFANILGSTVGTLLVGFVLIHYYGIETTLLLLACAGFLPAMLILVREYRSQPRSTLLPFRPAYALAGVAGLIVASVGVFPRPGDVVRAIHYADFDEVEVVAAAEDRTGVVVLKKQNDIITFPEESRAIGAYRLYIDGANHGGMHHLDQAAHDTTVRWALTAHPSPKRVLCIGLGNGNMCVSAVEWPSVEKLVVVELNSALASVLKQTANGREVLGSPKTELVQDDGRRWLLANPQEKFDLVMMFPLHAAHAHSGNLYSLEFFNLVKQHLSPEGLLFFHSVDCFATAKTVATVFPFVLRTNHTAYLASRREFTFDLHQLGWTAEEFSEQVEADGATILAHTENVPLNRDLKPNAEFYLTYAHRAWLSPRCKQPMYAAERRHGLAKLATPIRLVSASSDDARSSTR